MSIRDLTPIRLALSFEWKYKAMNAEGKNPNQILE